MREIIHQGRTRSQDRLIANLNPIVRGWALYHKYAQYPQMFSADMTLFSGGCSMHELKDDITNIT